jgi:hypothetical protein
LTEKLKARSLLGRLGPTEQHLVGFLDYRSWMNNFKRSKLGAGSYLALWVWPLAIEDENEPYPDRLAREIDASLQREPGLFNLFNDLIEARNAISHSKSSHAPGIFAHDPTDIDELLMRAWGAIEHGLAVSSKIPGG